jgi:hypothetical protein
MKSKMVFMIIWFLLINMPVMAQSIQPYSEIRYYWQYKGKPILLRGGSERFSPFQWEEAWQEQHLNLLVASGGNYIRNIMSANGNSLLGGIGQIGIHPFRKLSDGKFDLNHWNNEYWTKLDSFLQRTSDRDIIVSLEIFQHEDSDLYFAADDGGWGSQPWNPKNNINYTMAETGIPHVWSGSLNDPPNPFFTVIPDLRNISKVLQYQEKYVEKLLQITKEYENVIFVMDNESHWPHEIADYWSKYIHKQGVSMGRTFYVSDMRHVSDLTHEDHQYLIARPKLYGFFEVSQQNVVTYNGGAEEHWNNLQHFRQQISENPRPMNNVKIYGTDIMPLAFNRLKRSTRFGNIAGQNSFWMNLIGGCAAVRFHRQFGGLGLSTLAQNSLRAVDKLETKVKLWEVQPHNDLLSDRETFEVDVPDYDFAKKPFVYGEGYLAANPGQKYVLYFTQGGSVRLNLTAYSAVNFKLYWIDIDSGEWGPSQTFMGGSNIKITAPGSSAWVAAIVKQGKTIKAPAKFRLRLD